MASVVSTTTIGLQEDGEPTDKQTPYVLQETDDTMRQDNLGTCTLPPSANDLMVGTGCPKVGCQNPTNKGHLIEAPLNGDSPTFAVTQAVSSL